MIISAQQKLKLVGLLQVGRARIVAQRLKTRQNKNNSLINKSRLTFTGRIVKVLTTTAYYFILVLPKVSDSNKLGNYSIIIAVLTVILNIILKN